MDEFSCVLISILLLAISIKTVSCRVYYIFPMALGEPCDMDSCLTLSQFATNISGYVDPANTTLFIVGGSHDLDKDFSLSNVEQFSMLSKNDSLSSSVITCTNHPARFALTNNRQVYIRGIQFIECNGNLIKLVALLTIVNSGFVNSSSTTALTIINSHVNMDHCSFIGNSIGKSRNSLTANLQMAFGEFTADKLKTVGGAVIVTNSTLVVDGCQFVENEANIGGGIFSETESKLTIRDSVFVSNRATASKNRHRLCLGGALFVTGTSSTTVIQNSTFHNNTSGRYGGVAVVFKTDHALVTGVYKNNSNVGESPIVFESCTFENNIAMIGGVVYLHKSRNVSISDCNFLSNMAREMGGVIASNASSSVMVMSSHFAFNKAGSGGGVVNIQHKSELQIENSLLEQNSVNEDGGVIFTSQESVLKMNNLILPTIQPKMMEVWHS